MLSQTQQRIHATNIRVKRYIFCETDVKKVDRRVWGKISWSFYRYQQL